MKSFWYSAIFCFMTTILSSCGKGTAAHENDVIPDESGNFSFSFKPNNQCFGECDEFTKYETCETSHSFTSRRTYCLGLRDGSLNSGCARKERRAEYLQNCSPQFDDINVGGISSSGGDPRFGSCDWKIPLTTGLAFCKALADESQHKYCRWDDRRIEFKQYDCEGPFSDLPANLATMDDGAMALSDRYQYSTNNYTTYKRYRKTYKVSAHNPSVLSINSFVVKERTCDTKGKSRLEGVLVNLDSGERVTFDPSNKIPLKGAASYAIIVDAVNDGLCRQFHFSYNVEVR